MEYFSKGVTKDKLMILFGLKALGMQPTKVQLGDFFVANDLIGYFDAQTAAYELEEDGFIGAVPRPYGQAYFLTPAGEEILDMFSMNLPNSLRNRITECAKKSAPDMISKTKYSTSIARSGTYARVVTLRAMEPQGDVLRIEMMLPDDASARHACDVWEERSGDIYRFIHSELTRE